ncbi:universal stress protein [Mucilaginibacter paludis]|uniref:UspA domain-containing protein n=1 Tax=Mucilaginibacter paludis DSM 18603 TaxID=714943 RepID=H1YAQ6_9SPHI|nr:universal stress protein [Mucilaginibacter paludis]EHQ29515.1 UspA domain-containing protein [Mucilaginibacter paludis DSM 18603]
MKPILVINDHSPQAEHAARMALLMAQRLHADLLLANCHAYEWQMLEKAVAGSFNKDTGYHHYENDLRDELYRLSHTSTGFKPEISPIDLSGSSEAALAGFVMGHEVEMIICGVGPGTGSRESHISSGSLLRKVNCPILLVPYGWRLRNIWRIYYLADLRNCRLEVVNYLARLAAPWLADVFVANLCANGLAEMEEHYAQRFFEQRFRRHVSYPRLHFTPVAGNNVRRALEVFIEAMSADLLVLSNGCLHFDDALNGATIDELPAHLTVPLLVFP